MLAREYEQTWTKRTWNYCGDTPGTVIKDASEILPASRIFQYKHFATYAGFANFFRYKLLLERGGWWVDTDTICLKPFDFPEPQVFATEVFRGEAVVTSGIIKAPVGSAAMAYAWDVCQAKDPEKLVWGETGSVLLSGCPASVPSVVATPLANVVVRSTGAPFNIASM